MPLISTLGAASSRGFGQFAAQGGGKLYVEDVFSTYLYNGTGGGNTISNDVSLITTEAWSAAYLESPQDNSDFAFYDTYVDSSNNLYVAGFSQSGSFYNDGNIAKYNSAGVLQWQRSFQSNNSTRCYGITADSSGNVYVTGRGYRSDPEFSFYYMFVAKLDSDGNTTWRRWLYDNENNNTGRSVAVDSSGNVFAVGTVSNGSKTPTVLVKYNSSGSLQWRKKLDNDESNDPNEYGGFGLELDSSGNAYVVGSSKDGSNQRYILFAKYNTSGTLQFQKKLYQGGDSRGYRVRLDSSGNIYLACRLDSKGALIKLDSSGTVQFARSFTSRITDLRGLHIDASNNIYVSGSTTSPARGFVAKMNTSGTVSWQRSFYQPLSPATSNNTLFFGVTADSLGNVISCGRCIRNSSGNASSLLWTKIKADGTSVGGKAYVVLDTENLTFSSASITDNTPSAYAGDLGGQEGSSNISNNSAGNTNGLLTQAKTDSTGGLVWIKQRSSGAYGGHAFYDTARGKEYLLSSSGDGSGNSSAQATSAQYNTYSGTNNFISFLGDGFVLGQDNWFNKNASDQTYVSWTFRRAPKFFDVVQYTGNDTTQAISHNLGSAPGMIVVKRMNTTGSWRVYHRSFPTGYANLNTAGAFTTASAANVWGNNSSVVAPTSTTFTVGNDSSLNASGSTYVAYVFAHDTTADGIIQCGSYEGTGNSQQAINLGWEPQYLLIQRATVGSDWTIFDNMRKFDANYNPEFLTANNAAGTYTDIYPYIHVTSTGFETGTDGYLNQGTVVYMAIRRGPMRVPTDATKVFSPVLYNGDGSAKSITTGFTVDTEVVMARSSPGPWQPAWLSRLTGNGFYLQSSSTAATVDWSGNLSNEFQSNTGVNRADAYLNNNGNMVTESFRRAPGFFDVVCYSGTGSARTVGHNLGVAPEMMIVKCRSASPREWICYHTFLGANKVILPNRRDPANYNGSQWFGTSPTASVFTVNTDIATNDGGATYVAYLFASCPGVSKVGSYTGTGTTLQINCGFTAGARFVLIKRTDSPGDWYIWDSARGIVAGNDPYLFLNSAAAEVTSTDYVDTYALGFEISSSAPAEINGSGGTFIFLAIA